MLPKESDSQEIGRKAGKALTSQTPMKWIETPLDGDNDFGIDYMVQLKSDEGEIHFSFYLQLKGTTKPKLQDDIIKYSFEVKNINYYRNLEPLVMVAIADLSEDTDIVTEHPVYYRWLDEKWYADNTKSISEQDTVSVSIPLTQTVNPQLDIFNYYKNRIINLHASNQLQRKIEAKSLDVPATLSKLSITIEEKPFFLEAIEQSDNVPWLVDPHGDIATGLKLCSEYLNLNKIQNALDSLNELSYKCSVMNNFESAEYHHQYGNYYTLCGSHEKALQYFKKASSKHTNHRYKYAYYECMFRQEQVPTKEEIEYIIENIHDKETEGTVLKAKCLAIIGHSEKALDLLKSNDLYNNITKLIVYTLADLQDKVDSLISISTESDFSTDREKYLFNALLSRRLITMSNNNKMPISFDSLAAIDIKIHKERMSNALKACDRAWHFAKKLGYPQDLPILTEVSSLLYFYFNKVDHFFSILDEILNERSDSPELIRIYSNFAFSAERFELTADLISRLPKPFKSDELHTLFLSQAQYNPSLALSTLEAQKNAFKKLPIDQKGPIFGIAYGLAIKILELDKSIEYIKILEDDNDGEAYIALCEFFEQINNDLSDKDVLIKELHRKYSKYDKHPAIAEQLLGVANPTSKDQSKIIIDVFNELPDGSSVKENTFQVVTQAFLTNGLYKDAAAISENYICKENCDPYWYITQYLALAGKGEIGAALSVLQSALTKYGDSREFVERYVETCFFFNLQEEAEQQVKHLYSTSTQREAKVHYLSRLLAIYTSHDKYQEKLTLALKEFGRLVDRSNETEEASYLAHCVELQHANSELIEDFQSRLKTFQDNFPDSKVLWMVNIKDNTGKEILDAMHEAIGITDEQRKQWEKNRNQIRNGTLPVPFSLLHLYLPNTRDIYATWAYACFSPQDEAIEYKLHHSAPLMDRHALLSKNAIIVEESSLLVLNQIDLLDDLIGSIDQICLLSRTFTSLGNHSHPHSGSIASGIPIRILATIEKYKSKLVLLYDDEENIIESLQKQITENNYYFLCDDANINNLLEIGRMHGNTVDVIEFLYTSTAITEERKYKLLSDLCSIGILTPDIHISNLAKALCFYTNGETGIDYVETDFQPIFDSVFSIRRKTSDVVPIFFEMLFIASSEYTFRNNPETLKNLFQGILVRHQYVTPRVFCADWLIYQCRHLESKQSYKVQVHSEQHRTLWRVYGETVSILTSSDPTFNELCTVVIQRVLLSSPRNRDPTLEKIEGCFVPATKEAEAFQKILADLLVSSEF